MDQRFQQVNQLPEGEIDAKGQIFVFRKSGRTRLECPHHDDGCSSSCALCAEPYIGDRGDVFLYICQDRHWKFRKLVDHRSDRGLA